MVLVYYGGLGDRALHAVQGLHHPRGRTQGRSYSGQGGGYTVQGLHVFIILGAGLLFMSGGGGVV